MEEFFWGHPVTSPATWGGAMVLLDNGFLSSFDCGHRMGAIFLSSFLMQMAIVASFSASVRRPNRYGPGVEMLDEGPFFTRRRIAVWAVWCIVFTIVSGVSTLLRTPTAVLLDQTSIVETSCTGPFVSEYRLDRSKVDITFGHESEWLTKRPLETTYLAITQTDKPRPIFIHLKGRPGPKELQDLAPAAMAEYARYRSSQWFR
ncbi:MULTISPECIES: hypothetical protein [unclassified Rhizobium]|nr:MULTISPECIES: hypothetical protein [unclassified Rhizobium]MBN8954570.1 hypothetical protein [Rhizobium tropici]